MRKNPNGEPGGTGRGGIRASGSPLLPWLGGQAMRIRAALAVVGVGLLCQGCGLIVQTTRVVVAGVTRSFEDHAERQRNKKWAAAAWREVHAEAPDLSADYGAGFREGFAQYLYQGGNGQPPPLPPKRYRKLRYQTPEGYQAIADWFAGYRQGASSAHDGGFRRWVTGPSSLTAAVPLPPPPPPADGPVPTIHLKVLPPREERELPAPRQAPPAGGPPSGKNP